MPPKASHASSATRSANSTSPRSAAQIRDSGADALQSSRTSSRRSLRRATRPTVTPRRASDLARAAPMPDEAPVTSAVDPSVRFISPPRPPRLPPRSLTLASGSQLLHGRQLLAVVLGGSGAEREIGDRRADRGQVVEGAASAVGITKGVDGTRRRQHDLDVRVAPLPRLGLPSLGEHVLDLFRAEGEGHPAVGQLDSPSQRTRRLAADPDGHPLLHGAGVHDEALVVVELAVVGGLALAERRT